jgi:hypothetical protein
MGRPSLTLVAGALVAISVPPAVAATPAEGETGKPGSPGRSWADSVSGVWNQEWAFTDHGSQKFEAMVEPRLDVTVADGIDLTARVRLRGDTVGKLGPDQRWPDNYAPLSGPWYNSAHVEIIPREIFLDLSGERLFARLGKQQVVWGQADGLKVLDVVNPQSYREFILDDFDVSRIPLWTVSLEFPLGGAASLQALWVPDTTYHELAEAGSPFSFTSPRLVPLPPAGQPPPPLLDADKPDNPVADSDAGLRLSAFVGGWDLTLNYFYHYHDAPVLFRIGTAQGQEAIRPTYKRNHLIGGTFSNAFGDLTLRGELAYNTDTYHVSQSNKENYVSESPELASVLGLDWQVSADILWSAQWFQSYLFDHESATVRDRTEQVASLLFQYDFDNASWRLHLLGLYSLNDEDALVQAKLSHWLRSNLEVWVGTDLFSGTRRGVFGEFRDNNRMLVGFEYGF